MCPSVCHHFYGRNSHSIKTMKLWTIDRNPKSKNPFIEGQNPTIPSPIFPLFFTPVMHSLSMARSEHHSFEPSEPCGQIAVFDSSKDASLRPLYWRYTGDSEQCYNSMFTPKQNGIQALRQASVVVAIGNHNDVAMTSCH